VTVCRQLLSPTSQFCPLDTTILTPKIPSMTKPTHPPPLPLLTSTRQQLEEDCRPHHRAEELSDILTEGRGRGGGRCVRSWWCVWCAVCGVLCVVCRVWEGDSWETLLSFFLSFSFRGRDTLAHPSSLCSVVPDLRNSQSVKFLRYPTWTSPCPGPPRHTSQSLVEEGDWD
jgi:hypothetical protein